MLTNPARQVSQVVRRAIGRCVFNPLVRSGRLPTSGLSSRFLRRIGRDLRVPCSSQHPAHPLLQRTEWHTSYSLSDQSLIWLWSCLERRKPRGILEMGSGLSTLLFAVYARQGAGAKCPIVSIDHDEYWLALTKDRLTAMGNSQYVELVHSPVLDNLPEGANSRHGYQIDLSELRRRFRDCGPELVLIDGPPESVGRAGTLPSIIDLLPAGTDILLDDAYRPGELVAVDEWRRQYAPRLEFLGIVPVGDGLAWLRTK